MALSFPCGAAAFTVDLWPGLRLPVPFRLEQRAPQGSRSSAGCPRGWPMDLQGGRTLVGGCRRLWDGEALLLGDGAPLGDLLPLGCGLGPATTAQPSLPLAASLCFTEKIEPAPSTKPRRPGTPCTRGKRPISTPGPRSRLRGEKLGGSLIESGCSRERITWLPSARISATSCRWGGCSGCSPMAGKVAGVRTWPGGKRFDGTLSVSSGNQETDRGWRRREGNPRETTQNVPEGTTAGQTAGTSPCLL